MQLKRKWSITPLQANKVLIQLNVFCYFPNNFCCLKSAITSSKKHAYCNLYRRKSHTRLLEGYQRYQKTETRPLALVDQAGPDHDHHSTKVLGHHQEIANTQPTSKSHSPPWQDPAGIRRSSEASIGTQSTLCRPSSIYFRSLKQHWKCASQILTCTRTLINIQLKKEPPKFAIHTTSHFYGYNIPN